MGVNNFLFLYYFMEIDHVWRNIKGQEDKNRVYLVWWRIRITRKISLDRPHQLSQLIKYRTMVGTASW
jgi:hypothetical protein